MRPGISCVEKGWPRTLFFAGSASGAVTCVLLAVLFPELVHLFHNVSGVRLG